MSASASCELSASGRGGLAVAPVLDAKPDMAELEPDVAVLDRGGGRRVERGEDMADAAALLGVERREGRYRIGRHGLLDRRVDAKELEAPGGNGGGGPPPPPPRGPGPGPGGGGGRGGRGGRGG